MDYKIQLLYCKWNTKGDKNKIKKIERAGVVRGGQLVLSTKQIFSYNSWVQITTLAGVMNCEYLMKNLSTDQNFTVQVSSFYLFYPDIIY